MPLDGIDHVATVTTLPRSDRMACEMPVAIPHAVEGDLRFGTPSPHFT